MTNTYKVFKTESGLAVYPKQDDGSYSVNVDSAQLPDAAISQNKSAIDKLVKVNRADITQESLDNTRSDKRWIEISA